MIIKIRYIISTSFYVKHMLNYLRLWDLIYGFVKEEREPEIIYVGFMEKAALIFAFWNTKLALVELLGIILDNLLVILDFSRFMI